MYIARVKDDKGYECFLTYRSENDDKFDDELERNKLTLIEKIQVTGLIKDFIQYNYADTDYNNSFVVIRDVITKTEYVLVLSDEKVKAVSKLLAASFFRIVNINPITSKMADHIIELEKNSETNTKKNLDIIIDAIYNRTNNENNNIESLIGELLINYKNKAGMTKEEILKLISDLSNKASNQMKIEGFELPEECLQDFLKKLESIIE